MIEPIVGEILTPELSMRWALRIAERGAGFVSPNPMVGCVIVDSDHRFVAWGWHKRVGFQHAEIDALENFEKVKGSRAALRGCHVYVSLEPCAHEGRTPSCAKTLAPLAPASVTYALLDPNPLVAGKGAQILREAGVRVGDLSIFDSGTRDELLGLAEDVAEVFLHSMKNKTRPFVTVKVASSLDGRSAMKSGESQWITGVEAREASHRLRLKHDAILVGRSTIENDNPSLNVRLTGLSEHVNWVVVMDPSGKTLNGLEKRQIAAVRPRERIIVCVDESHSRNDVVASARSQGFRVIAIPYGVDGGFELRRLLEVLREMSIMSVYIEGGMRTIGHFMQAKLVDRLHVFLSTSIIGGENASGWSDGFGVSSLNEKIQIQRTRIETFGTDIHVTGRL